MKEKIKNESGITLAALVITIIIMMILSSIAVHEGSKLIRVSKVQTLETNMLTIQAKAKAYAEEIESKIWVYKEDESEKDTKRNDEFENKGMPITETIGTEALNQVSNDLKSDYVAYTVTGDVLTNMGLKEINTETYIVIFKKDNYKIMDVIYPDGITYQNSRYYTLSSIQEIMENV